MGAAVRRVRGNGGSASSAPGGESKGSRKQQKLENKQNHAVPIWLRLVLLATICLVALLLGSVIGYGLIGGGAPTDALKFDTWQHIVELVTSKN